MKYAYYTRETIRSISNKIAQTISIRTYTNGNSADVRRTTTTDEREKIFAAVYGALANLNRQIYGIGQSYGKVYDQKIRIMMQDARDNAEWIVDELITFEDGATINGYDTVYCPIWAMSEMLWGTESDFTERYCKFYGIKAEELEKENEAITA